MNHLWQELSKLEAKRLFEQQAYPSTLTRFPGRLAGQGFFPGGDGLWRTTPANKASNAFPVGGVMILGNDFGLLQDFRRCIEKGYENPPTWKIKELLRDAGIPADKCFFTNAYLGLRLTGPVKGPTPGLKTAGFIDMCLQFFDIQLQAQRPRLIVCLGKEPRRFAAKQLFTEGHEWCSQKSAAHLDSCLDPIQQASRNLGGITLHSRVIYITHPSDPRNYERYPRQYHELEGKAAEVALLREAWSSLSRPR